MALEHLNKLSVLQQKQLAKLIPLYTKMYGHVTTVYYPIERNGIYNRDSQDITYGANPDQTINLLYDRIPELRNEMDFMIDTFDMEEKPNIFAVTDSIPKDAMLRMSFNDYSWTFKVKDKKAYYGTDNKFLYVKYTLVGMS